MYLGNEKKIKGSGEVQQRKRHRTGCGDGN